MIVRWGITELGPLLREVGSERPLLVTSRRFEAIDIPVENRFAGVRTHAPTETVEAATRAAAEADALVALGGGSAVDTGKAVSAATGLPLVAVPTTYAGAEWTQYYGMRDEARRVKTGGSGTNTVGIVYEPPEGGTVAADGSTSDGGVSDARAGADHLRRHVIRGRDPCDPPRRRLQRPQS